MLCTVFNIGQSRIKVASHHRKVRATAGLHFRHLALSSTQYHLKAPRQILDNTFGLSRDYSFFAVSNALAPSRDLTITFSRFPHDAGGV
jgi:hypothetical protein